MLRLQAFPLIESGDYATASVLLTEILRLYQEVSDTRGIATTLLALALSETCLGNTAGGLAYQDESLRLFRELGEPAMVSNALNNMGLLLWEDGDIPQAIARLEQSLAICRRQGDRAGIAWRLHSLAWVILGEHDSVRARALLVEGLALALETGWMQGIADMFEGLAEVAALDRDPARAVRLWGAAVAQREATNYPIRELYGPSHQRAYSAVLALLAQPAWEPVAAEGRAMPVEQALAYALEEPVAADLRYYLDNVRFHVGPPF